MPPDRPGEADRRRARPAREYRPEPLHRHDRAHRTTAGREAEDADA